LVSVVARLLWIMSMKLGTPKETMIPTTAMVTINSSNVNPFDVFLHITAMSSYIRVDALSVGAYC